MESFTENLYEIADHNEKIVYFAKFCNKIHIKVSFENQGCNLRLLIK